MENNKYLLIPINDIEDRMNQLEKEINKGEFVHYHQGKLDMLTHLLKHHVDGELKYKQISLDEITIAHKAQAHMQWVEEDLENNYDRDSESANIIAAYEKALKDLL